MSLSPTAEVAADRSSYEAGWVAVHKLLREGKSWSGREEDCAYLNTGDGRFANVSAVSGLDLPDDTRAAARVDWDLDGRLDLWISGRNSPRVHFFRNQAPVAGAFVALLLRGTACNRDAIGARVEIHRADRPTLVSTVRAGEGYLAQSSRWMHFGLGDAEQIERVVVRWPAPHAEGVAAVEEFECAPNARHVLVQGSGQAQRWTAPAGVVALEPSQPPAHEPTERARIVLAARVPLPKLSMTAPDGQQGEITGVIQKPMLINLWASWCQPCVAELTEFARRSDELHQSGLSIVAVGCDEADQRATAMELLTRLQWSFHTGFASTELLDTLDVLQRALVDRRRRMPLPTSFLIDHEGRLAVIYKGPVVVDTLLADVSRLRAKPAEIRDAATPFPGRWHTEPAAADLARLEAAFAERGLADAAGDVARARVVLKESNQAHVLNEFGLAKARAGRLDEAIVHFRQAAELDLQFFDALSNLAAALHETGQVEAAIAAYESALRLDSRHAPTVFNLALARWVTGDEVGARQTAEWLRALDRDLASELEQQFAALGEH